MKIKDDLLNVEEYAVAAYISPPANEDAETDGESNEKAANEDGETVADKVDSE